MNKPMLILIGGRTASEKSSAAELLSKNLKEKGKIVLLLITTDCFSSKSSID
jgi:uridine kinase